MDLIATYLPFTITTSFLGLITAVWVGFRCKMAFSMPLSSSFRVISSSVRVITNRLRVIKETLRRIKKIFRRIRESLRGIKETVMTLVRPLRVIRKAFRTIKITTNHCNYGERLTLPI